MFIAGDLFEQTSDLCDVFVAGDLCEQTSDPCDSQPCLNGAECVITNTAEQYYCECQSGEHAV